MMMVHFVSQKLCCQKDRAGKEVNIIRCINPEAQFLQMDMELWISQ